MLHTPRIAYIEIAYIEIAHIEKERGVMTGFLNPSGPDSPFAYQVALRGYLLCANFTQKPILGNS
jgi:hypothetical protein